jgi:hypothetical protein
MKSESLRLRYEWKLIDILAVSLDSSRLDGLVNARI